MKTLKSSWWSKGEGQGRGEGWGVTRLGDAEQARGRRGVRERLGD